MYTLPKSAQTLSDTVTAEVKGKNVIFVDKSKYIPIMKQRTDLSTFCLISTIAGILLLIGIIVFSKEEPMAQLMVAGVLVAMLLSGLFYMPLNIGADKYAIYVNRSLKIKAIPMELVKSVRLCTPTMAARRISGSGGFMGYWGWFRERDLGTYFAYYGRSSDCFLVELINGRKYMLGCRNAQQMVEYIKSNISCK